VPAPVSPRQLVAAALLLCACRPPPVARPYPPPDAAELLARLDHQASVPGVLRSDAKVDYRGDGGERVKVRMTLVSRAPAALRVEAQGPLGGSVASLATDGRDFQFLDVRGNHFLAGPASACNISRLLRVELRPADLVALLAGGAPRLAEVTSMTAGWDGADGGREVLTLRGPAGEQEVVRFDGRERRWDVVQAELRGPDGAVLWRVEHGDFAEGPGGARLPGRSDIVQPPRGADVRVRYKGRESAPELTDSAFRLDAPPGLPVEPATCN